MPQIFALGGMPILKTPNTRVDKLRNTGKVDIFYSDNTPDLHENNFVMDNYRFTIMEVMYDINDSSMKMYQNPRAYSIAYRNVLEIITKDGITLNAENIAESPPDDNTP